MKPRVRRNCEICASEFLPRRRRGIEDKCCSIRCAGIYRRKKPNGTCVACSSAFVKRRDSSEYCSNECRSTARINTLKNLDAWYWSRVNKNGPDPSHVPGIGGCWLWRGPLTGIGYGLPNLNGRPTGAHRISWIAHNGEVPRNLLVLHRCDVPACVNPAHLFLGTHKDNAVDRHTKGRTKGLNWMGRGVA